MVATYRQLKASADTVPVRQYGGSGTWVAMAGFDFWRCRELECRNVTQGTAGQVRGFARRRIYR